MVKVFKQALWLTIIILALLRCKEIEDVQPEILGSISGKVYNQFSQPLEDVTIRITGNNYEKSIVTENGLFEFKSLRIGQYVLSASKVHYLDMSSTIHITNETPIIQDVQLKTGKAYLNVSDSLVTVTSGQGSMNLKIESNTSWALLSTKDWIGISKKNGEGNNEISISWNKNEDLTLRNGLIEISAGSIRKTIKIIQSSKLQILEYLGLPGNGKKGIVDSVLVKFNKEIKVKRIIPKWEICQSNLAFTYTNDKHGFKFSYACAALGGVYPFEIEVEDMEGAVSYETINVGFYLKKIEIQGSIVNYFVNEDDNSYWLITATPHRIYKIAMKDLTILKSFDLSFRPKHAALNYLTNELYVMDDSPDITVLSSEYGAVKRVVTVLPETDDHPDYPSIYPYDIKFTKNGLGIILLGSPESSGIRWRVVDSRKNDFMYRHKQFGYVEKNKYAYFADIHFNYDKSKLLLMDPYGSAVIVIFDQYTETLTEYMPPSFTRGAFIKPNRKNSKIYSGQLYNQLIVDPINSYHSLETVLDNRNDGTADFSYKENEPEVIYFWDNNYIQVLDYSRAFTKA